MPQYRPIWLEIARQQYDDLATDVRRMVDQRVAQLLETPTAAVGAVYNEHFDQWSVPLGREGFIFYAVVPDPASVIVLRLVTGFW